MNDEVKRAAASPVPADLSAPKPLRKTAAGHVGASFADTLALQRSRAEASSAQTDPRHLPLDTKLASEDFQAKALDVLAYRQQMIAANIANADTPYYYAQDIDWRKEMHQVLTAPPQLPLATTSDRHSPAQTVSTSAQLTRMYQVPSQGAVDGNSVEIDSERGKFAENSIRYEFAANQVADDYKEMQEMFANMKN